MTKVKMWEDECLPKIQVRNKEGDVALCVLWNSLDLVVRALPDSEKFPRLGVIGNLRTPLGISWFLRGLGKLSHITTVVVWGSDLTRTGKALLALWECGADNSHQIPGFGWKLDRLIDSDSVDRFRREVKLIDARDFDLKELGQFLSFLPQREQTRQPAAFPPVEIPDRQILPSRGNKYQGYS